VSGNVGQGEIQTRVLEAPSFPLLFPRALLALGATVLALVGPLWLAPVVAVAAGMLLWAVSAPRDGALRAVGWMGGMVLGFSLVLTPLTLVLLAGVGFSHAVWVSGALAVRLCAVVFIASAFKQAVSPAMVLSSLRWSPRLALALMVTLRQLPELTEDAVRLRRVQQARGLLVSRWGWRPMVFLVPLFSRSLARADRLSEALLLSGWGESRRRPLRPSRARLQDAWWALGGVLLIVVAVASRAAT
jgi:energy-coupling factor transporter transmembrane protein EcfT